MPACLHGDVCRAWMKETNSFVPLSSHCPNKCPYFEKLEDYRYNSIEHRLDALEKEYKSLDKYVRYL